MGIHNPVQIVDHRTEQILKEYLFYQKAPHDAPYDNDVWFESVILLNPIFTQRLF